MPRLDGAATHGHRVDSSRIHATSRVQFELGGTLRALTTGHAVSGGLRRFGNDATYAHGPLQRFGDENSASQETCLGAVFAPRHTGSDTSQQALSFCQPFSERLLHIFTSTMRKHVLTFHNGAAPAVSPDDLRRCLAESIGWPRAKISHDGRRIEFLDSRVDVLIDTDESENGKATTASIPDSHDTREVMGLYHAIRSIGWQLEGD